MPTQAIAQPTKFKRSPLAFRREENQPSQTIVTKKPSYKMTGLSLSQSIIGGRVISDYTAGISRLTLTTLFFSCSDLGSVRFKMPSL